MRRALQHQAPVFHQRVASAHGGADFGHEQAPISSHLQNFSERNLEILLDVVAERFEGRDVKNLGAVTQIAGERFADETVDAGKKCSQGFARSGGGRDQRGAAGEDVGPALLLRLGRRGEARREPLLHQRMSPGKGWRNYGRHGKDCSEKV